MVTMEAIAKEINVRLEKAAKAEDASYDHRLAAALRLANAKAECLRRDIAFKHWCEENIHYQYETVRKLTRVGCSDDPAKAIADMRGQNRKANKKLRDKKKVAKLQTPEDRIRDGFMALSEDGRAEEALQQVAEEWGMVAVPQKLDGVERIKAIYNGLSATEQMAVAAWVMQAVGVEYEV